MTPMNIDLKFWNWDAHQWQAAGKHAASFAAGIVALAAATHFISAQDASNLTDGVNNVYNGVMQVAKGVAEIVAILTPIYGMVKSAHNASPTSTIQRVEQIANDPTQATAPAAKKALAAATDSLPEVAGVIMNATPAGVALSNSVPSATVAPAGSDDAVKIAAAPLG